MSVRIFQALGVAATAHSFSLFGCLVVSQYSSETDDYMKALLSQVFFYVNRHIRQHFLQVPRVWFVLDQSISALTLAKLDDTHTRQVLSTIWIFYPLFFSVFPTFFFGKQWRSQQKPTCNFFRRKRNVWKRVDHITQCVLPNIFSHEKSRYALLHLQLWRRVFAQWWGFFATFVYLLLCIPPKLKGIAY